MVEYNDDNSLMRYHDPWYWSFTSPIELGKGPFEKEGREYLIDFMQDDSQIKVVQKATQGGYPIACSTPIPTPTGWTTMGDIKVGDNVFGTDGGVYSVTEAHKVKHGQECYEVIFSDGSSIVADGDHLWSLTDEKHYRYVKQVLIRTEDVFKTFKNKFRNRYAIDVPKPIITENVDLPIDSYLFGLWLGDGNSCSAQITCSFEDSIEYAKILEGFDIEIRHIDKRHPNIRNIKLNGYHSKLRKLGVLSNKHIPIGYLRADYTQRLNLLQGLMDSDGHITKKGKCEWYNVNKRLIDEVYELLMSLGLKAVVKKKALSTNWGATKLKDYYVYRISFRAYWDVPVARLTRKYKRQRSRTGSRVSETIRRRIKNVKKVDSVPVRCIGVDSPDHLFLAGKDFIPVHNTEATILIVTHDLIYGLIGGVLYFFPTGDSITRFAQTRFGPLIDNNPKHIKKFIRKTDNIQVKRIGKRGYLCLLSGNLSRKVGGVAKVSANLRGDPADMIVLDESDAMDPDVVFQAKMRLADSLLKREIHLSNPTIPEVGVHARFLESDQRYWVRKCVCGRETIAVLEYDKCVMVRKVEGREVGYIGCVKCGRELHPTEGYPEYRFWKPTQKSDIAGLSATPLRL
jgi:hypothetical protein